MLAYSLNHLLLLLLSLKKDKALVGRSLDQASKNVFVRVMNPSADTQIIYPGTIVAQVSPVQEVFL
jgi:hypothetical protein